MPFRLFGAAILLMSAGAIAASAQEQPAESEAKEEKKICRVDKATGSLTRRTRVCMTRAQWQEFHNRTRKGLDDFVGGAGGGCQAPNDPNKGTMC